MRLLVAAIGRLKGAAETELVDRYVGRLNVAGRSIALGPLEIVELLESRAATADLRKGDEARRLLEAAERADAHVALNVGGKMLTSEAFAKWLAGKRDAGSGTLAFLIGGPDGHGPAALEAATFNLSLGPMTLPHGLARIVLVEQLYRAATIIAGHPYHRG
jgi:23S rRNA (pseudouridine1915-N3)-methyltransferase